MVTSRSLRICFCLVAFHVLASVTPGQEKSTRTNWYVPDLSFLEAEPKRILTVSESRSGQAYNHGKLVTTAYFAKVVGISDGDTIKVLNDANEEIKIRLESIDCPETKQPFGDKSKQALSTMIFGKTVQIDETGKDRYGRTLAFVLLDGANVCESMIMQGMAWHYVEYSKSKTMAKLEANARNDKRGLWADMNPVAPWNWRRNKKSKNSIDMPEVKPSDDPIDMGDVIPDSNKKPLVTFDNGRALPTVDLPNLKSNEINQKYTDDE